MFTIMAAPAGMTFSMTTTVMLSISMSMMAAYRIWIIIQAACKKRFHLRICISACARKKLYSCLCKSISGSSSDSSAD